MKKFVLVDEAELEAARQAAPSLRTAEVIDFGTKPLLVLAINNQTIKQGNLAKYVKELQKYVRETLDKVSPDKPIQFFITMGDPDFKAFTEEAMAKAGWQRKPE